MLNLYIQAQPYFLEKKMNNVILSGKITSIEQMTCDIMLGVLEDEEQEYIIFWEDKNFNNVDLLNKQVIVIGNIKTIKLFNGNVRRTTIAYKLKEVEIINDI